jgi:hypothetical protein
VDVLNPGSGDSDGEPRGNGCVTFTRGHHSQRSFLMLVLAFEPEVTSYMTLNSVCRDATVVPDELVGQSGAGKVSLRLRIGCFGPPFPETDSVPPEKVTSTVRGFRR